MVDETKATPQVHHTDAGEVGETGEHGELGSNAASRLPSGADLDADAAEKAAAAKTAGAGDPMKDATAIGQMMAAAGMTRTEKVASIKATLIAAGYPEDRAEAMAETAVKNLETGS